MRKILLNIKHFFLEVFCSEKYNKPTLTKRFVHVSIGALLSIPFLLIINHPTILFIYIMVISFLLGIYDSLCSKMRFYYCLFLMKLLGCSIILCIFR